MDIQAASNFERLVFEALGRDAAATAAAFEGFEAGGALNLSGEALNAIRALGPARAVDEAETSRTMALAHDRGLGFVDPHTAVALAAAGILEAGDTREASPRVVLATAHPAKFPEAVSAATGDGVPPPAQVLALNGRPERVIRLPADLDALKSAIAGCLAL
jgi:threonine synthase